MKRLIIFLFFSLLIFPSINSQPTLDFVNFYSEGNPTVYGQYNNLLEVDEQGNTYMAGSFGYSIFLTDLPSHSNSKFGRNIYVTKYDNVGNGMWSFKIEGDGDNILVSDIKIDSEKNVIITGGLQGSADFDPGSGSQVVSTPGNHKGFIAKYDSSGNYLWHQAFGSSGWQVQGEGIVIDEDDNIYVTGDTGNLLSIGGTTLSALAPSLYIARFDKDGELDWVRDYMKVYDQVGERITIAGDKITVVTAFTFHDFDPGPGTDYVEAKGDNDLLIIQVNKDNGSIIDQDYVEWSRTQFPFKVVGFDDGTYTILFKTYSEDLELLSGTIYSKAEHRHYLYVNNNDFSLRTFDVGKDDELYVALSGKGSLTYNPVNAMYEFTGDPNGYLRKIAPNGNSVWEHKWISTKGQYGGHMHVSDENEIYLTGTYYGEGNFELNNDDLDYDPSSDVDGFLVKWKDCESVKSYDAVAGCSPFIHEDVTYYNSGTYILDYPDQDGCLALTELEVEVFQIDSLIEATSNQISSLQSDDMTSFTWWNYETNKTLMESSNILTPEHPGQYQFSCLTSNGCEFSSSIITVPEIELNRILGRTVYGNDIFLIDSSIFVRSNLNLRKHVDEIIIDDLGEQTIQNNFNQWEEVIGTKIIKYKNGVLINSDKGKIYYYTRSETGELLLHSEILKPETTHTLGFGDALAVYDDLLFVGAHNTLISGKFSAGKVQVFMFINNNWEWQSTIVSPNIEAYNFFGQEIYIADSLLFIAEPGYENQFGTGAIHSYNLNNWSHIGSEFLAPDHTISSTEEYANFSDDIAHYSNSMYFRNNDQIFKQNIGNWELKPTEVAISNTSSNLQNIKIQSNWLAFSTPDANFQGSNQVHLYQLSDSKVEHKITFFPYVQNTEFGTVYDLNENQIVIGAPSYYNGSLTSRLGKIVIYPFRDVLNEDLDNDGYVYSEDCNDDNPLINPGAEEIAYNDIDDDCNPETPDNDLDNDGFLLADDCDDTNSDINPNMDEIPYNGLDDDCDPDTFDDDLDLDGFVLSEDCDDTNPNINPSADEIPNNGIDENCDGIIVYIDEDMDGFNSSEDCDDNDPNINPDQEEIYNNDVDENCDGIIVPIDEDNDGFLSDVDCNDLDSLINPSALEIHGNDIDENCDGILWEFSITSLDSTYIFLHDVSDIHMVDMNANEILDVLYCTGSEIGYVSVHDQFSKKVIHEGINKTFTHISAGDLNNDNIVDIVASTKQNLYRIMGNSDGGFDELVEINDKEVDQIEVLDIDNNGWLDIAYVYRAFNFKLGVVFNVFDSPNTYVHSEHWPQFKSLAFNDFDNDGDLDVFHTGSSYTQASVSVSVNENVWGDFFTSKTPIYQEGVAHSIIFNDYDNDGDDDLISSIHFNQNNLSGLMVFLNDNGNFSEGEMLSEIATLQNLATINLDKDCDDDYVLSSQPLEFVHRINETKYSQEIPDITSGLHIVNLEAGDVNGDLRKDIIFTHTNKLSIAINLESTLLEISDIDEDGYSGDEDCDDCNSTINSDADEIPNNDIDENCDGIIEIISSTNNVGNSPIIFPNPNNGMFFIKSNNIIDNVELYDLSGRLVYKFGIQDSYDISECKTGVYILKMILKNGNSAYSKVIKH